MFFEGRDNASEVKVLKERVDAEKAAEKRKRAADEAKAAEVMPQKKVIFSNQKLIMINI